MLCGEAERNIAMAAVHGNGMLLSTVPKLLQLGVDLGACGFAPNIAPKKNHHACKFYKI